uniref:Uncharacterized protein n=1 Tax=Ditylenchus dipsaci TaxID=166011 RepID=A0A915CXZ8_9BILA
MNRNVSNEMCKHKIDQIHLFNKDFPLLKRVNYNPSKSVLVRKLNFYNTTRAYRSQVGHYVDNNLASIQLRFRSMTVVKAEQSYKYNTFNFLVDMGSTLGLYFGMTILTVFELVIFVFYRDASNPFQVQNVPPQATIYNIPAAATKNSLKQRGKPIILKKRPPIILCQPCSKMNLHSFY